MIENENEDNIPEPLEFRPTLEAPHGITPAFVSEIITTAVTRHSMNSARTAQSNDNRLGASEIDFSSLQAPSKPAASAARISNGKLAREPVRMCSKGLEPTLLIRRRESGEICRLPLICPNAIVHQQTTCPDV